MTQNSLPDIIKKLHKVQEEKDKSKEAKILLELAQFYYNEENYEKARFLLHEILEIKPDEKEIHYNLALIEIQYNNIKNAITHLNKEIKLNPKNTKVKQLKEKLQIKSNLPVITLSILAINIIIFLLTYPQINPEQLIKFTASNQTLTIFSAITSIFFHVNLIHIIFNSIILLMFGLILEKNLGSLKFLAIYLISGIIGNAIQAYFSQDAFVLGASAALFALIGGIIMKEPLLNLRIFGIIKAPIILVFGGFFAIYSIVDYFLPSGLYTGQLSHIIGFLCGIFLVAIMYQETIDTFYNWLMIFFGFWILQFSITSFLSNQIYEIAHLAYLLLLIMIAAYMIFYSYTIQKRIKEKITN